MGKMKKPLPFVLLLCLLTPGLAMAQSAFDGTWKLDLKTAQFPKKPDVYLLQDGMYHCKTCVPSIDVKADGQDQKVVGQPYFDMMSVKVVDDRTIAQTQKNTRFRDPGGRARWIRFPITVCCSPIRLRVTA
jgi:hypothetical protein